MTNPASEFSDLVLARLTQSFGPPRVIPPCGNGAFYRWILQRPRGNSIYLTLNFPERVDIAYVLISDPALSIEPVIILTLHTLSQVEAAIERINRQRESGH